MEEAASMAASAAGHACRQAMMRALLGWQALLREAHEAAARLEAERQASAAAFALRSLLTRSLGALRAAAQLRKLAQGVAEAHCRRLLQSHVRTLLHR